MFPTIVAPWWSYSKAMVASQYGAEEVYIGVPFTSLRMRQNKLKDFEITKKTVEDLHKNGTKALLTMNIFPRNQDIKLFEMIVERISDLGADAIIFSDPWTFHTIKKYLPNTRLHLSTQTTTLNRAACKFWYDLGVSRIVLARELHIDEIKQIKEKVPGLELETFVHGSMCMAYSGRCLLGDYLSGRPGNRWECANDCRFKYKVYLEEERRPWKFMQMDNDEDWSFILSSKDLCAIERLQEIIPYVDAIKIEWRSKSEFYVWAIVKAYKHVRDCILNGKKIDDEIKNLVNVIPHRQYRDGFLFNELKDYPEREEVTTTLDTAGPLFNRNYFWVFSDNFIEHKGKQYFEFNPKEVITRGMKLKYFSPKKMWEITIVDILWPGRKELEKATCNTPKVYILTDKKLSGWENLYIEN